jgi:stage II sporulation protein D
LQKNEFVSWLVRPFVAGLLAGVTVLLLPLLLIGEGQAEEPSQLLPAEIPVPTESVSVQRELWDEENAIRLLTESGQVEELTLKEYLWRVVAAEMPAR